jgi:hypothetical protein
MSFSIWFQRKDIERNILHYDQTESNGLIRRACITNFRSVSNLTLSIGQYHNTLCYRYKKLKEDLFLMEICINGKIFKGQSTMIFKVIQMDTLDLLGSVQ